MSFHIVLALTAAGAAATTAAEAAATTAAAAVVWSRGIDLEVRGKRINTRLE